MRGEHSKWLVTGVLSTCHGVQHFYIRLVPPLIPVLAVTLSFPLWKLGMIVGMYSFGSAIFQTPMGILTDRYNRRYILPPGIGVLAFGYVMVGLTPVLSGYVPGVSVLSFDLSSVFLVLSAGMFLAGLGDSVVHPSGYALITANATAGTKGRAIGVWGSSSKVGEAIAPATVGVLILVTEWNVILTGFGVLGVAYAALLFVVFRQDRFEMEPPAVASGTDDSDGSFWDRDRRLFVYPLLVFLLFFAVRSVATKGVNTFVPQFVAEVYGYTVVAFGTQFGPETLANFYFSALLITAAAAQIVSGLLTDRYDSRMVLCGSFLVAAVALVVLSSVTLSPAWLLFVLLVVGGGLWGGNPARDALLSDISPASREGRTFGYVWTFANLVGSLSPPLVGYIADTSGIQRGFFYLGVAAFVAALVVALLFSGRLYRRRSAR